MLYSDAAEDDTDWVDRLYSATGVARRFDIQPTDVLWHALGWSDSAQLNACKERARVAAGGHRHRAAEDVRYLCELYKLLAKGTADK